MLMCSGFVQRIDGGVDRTDRNQSMRQMNSGVSGYAPKIFHIANPGAQDTQRKETSEQHFMELTKLPRSAVALYSLQQFVEVAC